MNNIDTASQVSLNTARDSSIYGLILDNLCCYLCKCIPVFSKAHIVVCLAVSTKPIILKSGEIFVTSLVKYCIITHLVTEQLLVVAVFACLCTTQL